MKNVMNNLKKVSLMVALFATVLAYAADGKFRIKNSTERTELTLENVKVGDLFLIKSERGVILYKETIEQMGLYRKGFDFTKLPDGKYFFELEKDVEIVTIPFTVKNNLFSYDKALATSLFKPITSVKGDQVFINKLSLNNESLSIKVFFETGVYVKDYQLIHSELIKNTKEIKRVYKIKNFNKGKYKIVYRTEDRTFTEYI